MEDAHHRLSAMKNKVMSFACSLHFGSLFLTSNLLKPKTTAMMGFYFAIWLLSKAATSSIAEAVLIMHSHTLCYAYNDI